MEKKLLMENPDRWYYCFPELSLQELLAPAGRVKVHQAEGYVYELTDYPVTIHLKHGIIYTTSVHEATIIINGHTDYLFMPGYGGFMGSHLPDGIPAEGATKLRLEIGLHWPIFQEEETWTEIQIRSLYTDFARKLLGPWYVSGPRRWKSSGWS